MFNSFKNVKAVLAAFNQAKALFVSSFNLHYLYQMLGQPGVYSGVAGRTPRIQSQGLHVSSANCYTIYLITFKQKKRNKTIKRQKNYL